VPKETCPSSRRYFDGISQTKKLPLQCLAVLQVVRERPSWGPVIAKAAGCRPIARDCRDRTLIEMPRRRRPTRLLVIRSSSLSVSRPVKSTNIHRCNSVNTLVPSNSKSLVLTGDPSRLSPRIPLELVEHILSYVTSDCIKSLSVSSECFDPAEPRAIDFASIASFSLASSTFRKIALRHYFSVLTLRSTNHSARLWRLLFAQGGGQGFSWVKYMYRSLGPGQQVYRR
jgi:hypothetical protein